MKKKYFKFRKDRNASKYNEVFFSLFCAIKWFRNVSNVPKVVEVYKIPFLSKKIDGSVMKSETKQKWTTSRI